MYASSWSLVGSRFGHDDEIENAHDQKAELRNMIEQALKEATPVTCQIYGHVIGACVECNTHGEVTKQVPITYDDARELYVAKHPFQNGVSMVSIMEFVRAIEAHHGIKP